MGGIGVASFMGDLGGGSNPDSKMDDYFGDFDFMASRPVMWGAMRYKLSPSFAMKLSLAFGQVSGDDQWSGDPSRQKRNLNFKSPLFEQSLQVEYSIIKESNARKWNRRRKKRVRGASFNLYAFTGIAGVYFEPKGLSPTGTWEKLRPLGTEGQTIEGGSTYNNYIAAIPYGLGIKIGLNRKWDFGFEYGFRYTFTDYIDDVGTSYHDNKEIIEANGGSILAGRMADKNLSGNTFNKGINDPQDPQYKYNGLYDIGDRIPIEGSEEAMSVRGGDANDIYMFFLFSFCYKMQTKRNGLPKF